MWELLGSRRFLKIICDPTTGMSPTPGERTGGHSDRGAVGEQFFTAELKEQSHFFPASCCWRTQCPCFGNSMPAFTQCLRSATSETPTSLAAWIKGFSQTSFANAFLLGQTIFGLPGSSISGFSP